jgi:heavy metal sensor kinase
VTLTNRLTLFFLTALAVVLAAFSVTLYALARSHLTRQVDERARANLDTLVVAAEIEPDGLEWNRRQRSLWPRRDEPTVWAVFDAQGREVDGEPDHVRLLHSYAVAAEGEPDTRSSASWQGERWRVYCRTLSHSEPNVRDRRAGPGEDRNPDDERYRSLIFAIAAPLEPAYGTARTLAWCLLGVSAAVWLVAACVGRWLCRRALAPLTKMSGAVKAFNAADLGGRLPVPDTRDELDDLAVSFNDLLARLQEAFERQRRFTGEASHQLRTPLTAMLGQMEVALRRDRAPEEYRRVLASAVAQAGRLRQIVEALLFLARADAEAQLPDLETVDLVGWLPHHVAEAWKDHPRSNDLRLEPPERDALPVRAQPTLLGQAADNLIDNAFKYSVPGSPVRVALNSGAGWAAVAVQDEGPGIAAADVGRVFDPFFRTEEARRRGVAGLGLGLAVADRIVRAFGGRIEVRGGANNGCVFTILLPLCAETPTAIVDGDSSPRSAGVEQGAASRLGRP